MYVVQLLLLCSTIELWLHTLFLGFLLYLHKTKPPIVLSLNQTPRQRKIPQGEASVFTRQACEITAVQAGSFDTPGM